jgi:hypothetical protein
MAKRPFFVQSNGDCIPLEGDWRVAALAGDWYVLGHHSVLPCGSERAARSTLEELTAQTDVDLLASEPIACMDRIPDTWETDSLGEADLA